MVKEVPEVAPTSSEPEVEECASVEMNRALSLTKSGVPVDDTQVTSPPLWNLYVVGWSFSLQQYVCELMLLLHTVFDRAKSVSTS